MGDEAAFDAFLTLAEVGVGLVGFTGIVLALTRRAVPITESERLQIQDMIAGGLFAIAASLAPIGALLLGMHGETLWRTLSGTHAAVIVLLALPHLALRIRRLPTEERGSAIYVGIYAVGAGVFVVQLANALGWPFPPSSGAYFFGVCGPLVATAVYFGRLLFARLT